MDQTASLNVWKLSIGVPNAFSKSDIFTSPAREAVIYFTATGKEKGRREETAIKAGYYEQIFIVCWVVVIWQKCNGSNFGSICLTMKKLKSFNQCQTATKICDIDSLCCAFNHPEFFKRRKRKFNRLQRLIENHGKITSLSRDKSREVTKQREEEEKEEEYSSTFKAFVLFISQSNEHPPQRPLRPERKSLSCAISKSLWSLSYIVTSGHIFSLSNSFTKILRAWKESGNKTGSGNSARGSETRRYCWKNCLFFFRASDIARIVGKSVQVSWKSVIMCW